MMVALDALRGNDDLAAIYDTYLRHDDAGTPAQHWRLLFQSFVPGEAGGLVLRDEGRIVGLLGTCFADRWINGRVRRFCNLHTWIVDEAYRGHSLRMMRAVLNRPVDCFTDFTPTPAVGAISARLGFRQLESTLRLLLPGAPRSQRGGRWRQIELIDQPSAVHAMLSEPQQRMLRDLDNWPCQFLGVRQGDRHCLVAFSRVDRHALPYCYVHSMSDRALFLAALDLLRRELPRRTGTRLLAVESRHLPPHDVPGFALPGRSLQLYRSQHVQPEQIDTLYSEVQLLRLTTCPSLRVGLRRLAETVSWRGKILPSRRLAGS